MLDDTVSYVRSWFVLLTIVGVAALSELNDAKEAGLKLLALHYGDILSTDGASAATH
jgi:hypothetical protein